jgi:hypothetical protein
MYRRNPQNDGKLLDKHQLTSKNIMLRVFNTIFLEGSGRGQISSTISKFPKGTETHYEEPKLEWSVGPQKFRMIAFRIAYHFNQHAWLPNVTLLMRSSRFCQRCW